MDIPGYGVVNGQWDLRGREHEYLGGVDFKGKRVLEIGTASGFLCFYMEKEGAEVVAYDLSESQSWDIVPYCQYNYKQFALKRREHIKRLNNSFWLAYRAYNSNAKMVYGTVYTIPEEIGMFDISTLCCVLLHVRDPFLALQNVLRHTKETVVIIEPFLIRYFLLRLLGNKLIGPNMRFAPDCSTCQAKESWWALSPDIVSKFIGVLGFEKVKVKYHFQKLMGKKRRLYTIVGRRTTKI